MTDIRERLTVGIAERDATIERLTKALKAAGGYLMNAKIDLTTGAPKRTAINTIEGGLRMVEAALEPDRAATGGGTR